MSTFTNSSSRTFVAAADIAIGIRVKLNANVNEVAIAGATEDYVGVTETPVASGRAVSVRLKNSGGTAHFIAGGAFAYGASVYGIAAGKVDDISSGNVLVGTALKAASSDGSIVEVLLA